MAPRKVTIVGSGNWGSAIARIVGSTVKTHSDEFQSEVVMWVYEEIVDGKKLSEVINTEHENIKYLPGKKLPTNVVAVTDLVESCKDADILIFVVPHQHVPRICSSLKGKLKSNTIAISLIKGLAGVQKDSSLRLVSEDINQTLGIDVAVLMGANLAPEVASDNYCEATIGTAKQEHGLVLKKLFHTDNFRINVVNDAHTVELCGALKNVVACAAGFSDGLGYGDNTKAAVIRLGLMEIVKFINEFYPTANLETFFESCGIADLITTCYGGRNRKVCEAFVKTGKPLAEVEKELLNGQSAQGPLTAEELYDTLKVNNVLDKYPLMVAVNRICKGELKASQLVDCLRNHPEHSGHGFHQK